MIAWRKLDLLVCIQTTRQNQVYAVCTQHEPGAAGCVDRLSTLLFFRHSPDDQTAVSSGRGHRIPFHFTRPRLAFRVAFFFERVSTTAGSLLSGREGRVGTSSALP